MKKFGLLTVLLALAGLNVSLAQENATGYNPNSVYPIHDADIMFEKRVWRRMDLREKQNQAFYASNREITKVIIEAAKAGLIQPYVNDSLLTPMSKEIFLEKLIIPGTEDAAADEFGGDTGGGWGDTGGGWGDAGGEEAAEPAAPAGPAYYLPNNLTVLEISEDMIFDKKRSRMYFDIQSITLMLPQNDAGLILPLATFKYKDLEKLFRSMPEEAIWFNRQNSRGHLNLADAFNLRLFAARIIKVANPGDEYIVDVYNKTPKQAILASDWLEQQLMEYEHELWEF